MKGLRCAWRVSCSLAFTPKTCAALHLLQAALCFIPMRRSLAETFRMQGFNSRSALCEFEAAYDFLASECDATSAHFQASAERNANLSSSAAR